MLELFLYACLMQDSGVYACEITSGDPYYQTITSSKNEQISRIYDQVKKTAPNDCEAKGVLIKIVNEAMGTPLKELDHVCIKITTVDSEIKARLHFETREN